MRKWWSHVDIFLFSVRPQTNCSELYKPTIFSLLVAYVVGSQTVNDAGTATTEAEMALNRMYANSNVSEHHLQYLHVKRLTGVRTFRNFRISYSTTGQIASSLGRRHAEDGRASKYQLIPRANAVDECKRTYAHAHQQKEISVGYRRPSRNQIAVDLIWLWFEVGYGWD